MVAGWRINTVWEEGVIAGFPPSTYPWTPRAICVNLHPAPHPLCACGHHVTPDRDALLDYARRADTIAPARVWGTYNRTRSHPDDGTAKILVYAETAGIVHGRRSWEPPTTVRAGRLSILAAHIPYAARHLADPIRGHYPDLPIELHNAGTLDL